ncbi:hypothetical protein B7494_g1558 [Chlorociboria aeruginascens]|nr:hypothetical protein B7494_g1558 [Chlorociboria aeruginascens]
MTTAAPLHATPAHNLSASARAEASPLVDDNTYIPRGDVTATLNYFQPPEDGSAPFNYVEKAPEGQPQRNFGDFNMQVPFKDIRGQESNFTLDKDAFKVVSNVPESAERDFVDDDSIKKNYYPEVEKLILDNVPGSNRVFIFDHTIRRSNPDAPRAPVQKVHIDQTPKSAKQRVNRHLPEEAEKLLQGRYRIINIWRPLNGPVQASPLGFASSSTLKDEDLIPIEHRYPDTTGETAGIVYNASQKWHYLSGMKNNERLFLECFDSDSLKSGSQVQGGRVPHTAFADPRTPRGAPGRESIELVGLFSKTTISIMNAHAYHWAKSSGLSAGVPSISTITPPSNLSSNPPSFDAIVIGAGYAGLTAARDLTLSGYKVLLLEARTRIGGRSYSTTTKEHVFDLGGTWVHENQPNVWRNICRYNMQDQLEKSMDYSVGLNEFMLDTKEGRRAMSHDEEDALIEASLLKFINIDSAYGRSLLPDPWFLLSHPSLHPYISLSASDRISQISSALSPTELLALESFILLCSGSTLRKTSFLEFLHWWALCGYSFQGCIAHLDTFAFKDGQSSFAIRFFEEAVATGRLSYVFNAPVTEVKDLVSSGVDVTTTSSQTFHARKIICTIPLNVLTSIAFSPPLPGIKNEAIKIGHMNQCTKIHVVVKGKEMRSWSSIKDPSENAMFYMFGDGIVEDKEVGETHLVVFGADEVKLHPEEDIDVTLGVLREFKEDIDIQDVIFHNWSKDPYSKGAWFFPSPTLTASHVSALRNPNYNIHFASSDWALGWRSFIDGAIDEGGRAAVEVGRELGS